VVSLSSARIDARCTNVTLPIRLTLILPWLIKVHSVRSDTEIMLAACAGRTHSGSGCVDGKRVVTGLADVDVADRFAFVLRIARFSEDDLWGFSSGIADPLGQRLGGGKRRLARLILATSAHAA
jgi:hypothetical protein